MRKQFIIILLLLTGVLQAQHSGISITGGIGTFDLQGLKDYHTELIGRMPVELKEFSSYPPYSNIRINLFKQTISGLKYGLVFGYTTSGAHANYTDVSGYLNLNQEIKAYQFGASASYRILYLNYFEVSAYGDMRLSYVRNNTNMNITTSYFYENNTLKLSATSPFAEIGLEALYHFNKVSLGAEGGYLYDFGSKFDPGLQSVSQPTVSLIPTTELRSEMSGFRVGIKLILWINTLITE